MKKVEARNILVIKWGALGDLIASTTAIRILRENYPEANITLLTNPLMLQILPEGFLVNKHITINTRRNKVIDSVFKQISTILKLRKYKYDLCINLRWTSERAALMTYLSGAKVRISSGPKNAMKFYTIQLKHPEGRYHEIHRNLDIMKALGCSVEDENPVVYYSENAEQNVKKFFEENDLIKEKTLCIHPGASKPNRAWMPERFAEIGKRIVSDYDAKVLLTWGRGEEQLVAKVAEMIGEKAVISYETKTIGDLAAMISNCKLFLSNCTGPMNVAVAVKTPVVALLGSSDPTDWGAYGKEHINIKSPLVLEHYSDEDERMAFEAITINSVLEVIYKRWKELDG